MKQVKEESEKNKMSEARRNKEVAQFRKEQLRKENVIRTLEKEKKQKEMVLRRKQEEVCNSIITGHCFHVYRYNLVTELL